jgi:hypothetical protein
MAKPAPCRSLIRAVGTLLLHRGREHRCKDIRARKSTTTPNARTGRGRMTPPRESNLLPLRRSMLFPLGPGTPRAQDMHRRSTGVAVGYLHTDVTINTPRLPWAMASNHERHAKRPGGRTVVPKSLGHDGARDAAGAMLHSAELDETTTPAPTTSLFAVKPPGPATTLGRSIPPLHTHDSIEHAADTPKLKRYLSQGHRSLEPVPPGTAMKVRFFFEIFSRGKKASLPVQLKRSHKVGAVLRNKNSIWKRRNGTNELQGGNYWRSVEWTWVSRTGEHHDVRHSLRYA